MKIFSIILAIIIVGVVALGVVLATETWNPAWNPFVKTNQAGFTFSEIETAARNVSEVDTAKFDIMFSIDITNPKTSVLLSLTGVQDDSTTEEAKSEMDMSLIVLGADSTEQAKVEASMIFIGEKLYIKVVDLAIPDFPLFDVSLLSSIFDQWIELDLPELQEMVSSIAATDIAYDETQTKALADDLLKLVKKNNLFMPKEYLGEEGEGAELSDHYVLSINKEGLKKIIPAYFALLEEHNLITQQSDEIMQELDAKMPEVQQTIDEVWEKIGGVDFDVWVLREGKILNRVRIEKEITEEQVADTGGAGSAVIAFDLKLSHFNEPVVIETPVDAITLDEVLTSFFMGFGSDI